MSTKSSTEPPAQAESLIEVVYASGATRPFDDEELAELLEKARANNHALGVSGILLYLDGSFLQVLEGPEEAVHALYDKIALDKRHNNVLVLKKSSIETRTFGEWKMGCVSLDKSRLHEIPGFSRFLRSGVLHVEEGDGDQLRKILSAFRDGRYRRYVNDA